MNANEEKIARMLKEQLTFVHDWLEFQLLWIRTDLAKWIKEQGVK